MNVVIGGEFQSTLPHGERLWFGTNSTRTMSFNPRSHMGSDSSAVAIFCPAKVSIHAPTWGATEARRRAEERRRVSIHAPTWGATSPTLSSSAPSGFQSTLPHGERPTGPTITAATSGVSIHAPTWGATATIAAALSFTRVSIHAPTWGATSYSPMSEKGQLVSIHAPTWGATVVECLAENC